MSLNQAQLTLAFFTTAIIYLASISFTPYIGQFAVKVAPIICLLMMVRAINEPGLKRLMTVAIVASGIGDVVLALPMANSFIFGLGAFLVAQLVYGVIYFRAKTSDFSLKIKLIVPAIVLFAVAMAQYILPATGEMFVPVVIYLMVITLMAIAAVISKFSSLVGLGAMTFLVSDAVLATSIFKDPLPYSTFIVMFTYYGAQFLMVKGVLISTNQAAPVEPSLQAS